MRASSSSRLLLLHHAVNKRMSVSLPPRHLAQSPRFFATTHFGFQDVEEGEKAKKVHEVFANVAGRYDLMNDAMSMGIHRVWKNYFVHRLNPQPNWKHLDVAGGTGDIAFRVLRKMQAVKGSTGHVTVLDINQNMLDLWQLHCGNAKDVSRAFLERLSWVCGDAESLPFDDQSFDAYTIAFGIRNCTHVDKVVAEAYRVLKKGGRFFCLEFSQVKNPLLRSVYDQYSFQVIPVLGHVLAGDWHSYQYLVESIRRFPRQEEFRDMISTAGFQGSAYENLTFGTCAVHCGFKR